MVRPCILALLAASSLGGASPAFADQVTAAQVERVSSGELSVQWSGTDPVDVFLANKFDGTADSAKIIARGTRTGRLTVPAAAHERPFLLLRDARTGETVRAAERIVQLDQGTNFRDLGGYTTTNGKHVRWGLLYRSGGQAMLTDADVQEVRGLGIVDLIDLRSNEERVLAPTRLDGIRYQAVGYSMGALRFDPSQLQAMKKNPGASLMAAYRKLPDMLIPHLKIVFRTMLADGGPLVYNCSAGQDRTGLVSALILQTLGVPRDQLYADYVLTTKARRAQWELPPISPEQAQSSPVAAMWAAIQADPDFGKPRPLVGTDGVPYLAVAFGQIEQEWGSVDNYLEKGVGLGPADMARLRAIYLE